MLFRDQKDNNPSTSSVYWKTSRILEFLLFLGFIMPKYLELNLWTLGIVPSQYSSCCLNK